MPASFLANGSREPLSLCETSRWGGVSVATEGAAEMCLAWLRIREVGRAAAPESDAGSRSTQQPWTRYPPQTRHVNQLLRVGSESPETRNASQTMQPAPNYS